MKKITKTIAATISACAILSASLPVSTSAAEESIQPRGSYHLYGDVNNNGYIDSVDATLVLRANRIFSELTGDSGLPLSYAVARPSIYFEGIENPVPKAADTNGDGIINEDDANDIMRYYSLASSDKLSEYNGKCGTPFYIQ